MSNGMSVVPQMTYDNAMAEDQEWDVVLIPGGSGARPWFESNKGTRDFLVKVGPKCKYVLTGKSLSQIDLLVPMALIALCTAWNAEASLYRILAALRYWVTGWTESDEQQAGTQECSGELHVAHDMYVTTLKDQEQTKGHNIEWVPKARYVPRCR